MLGTDGQIGRYVIRRRLAYGGMGTLYLAHDPVLDRTVVLKLFHADLEGPDARERFVREARAVAALNNPNIVTIYDYGEYSSQPFLVMEYIDGETLAALIRRRPSLPTIVKVRWMEDLCAAVGYAHERGIIHRDIKPANLMIDAYGRIKVLDFGIARMHGTIVTKTTGLIGTPGYVAPELIRGNVADRRSDVFSIGVVCYELFSYVEPFGTGTTFAMNHRILNEDPVPLDVVQPGLPPELPSLVARALLKDPEQRFERAEMMRDVLTGVRRYVEAAEPATVSASGAMLRELIPSITSSPSRDDRPPTAPVVTNPPVGATPVAGLPLATPVRTPRQSTREALARQREEQLQGWIQLARDHIAAGEIADAREACAQALKLEPAHAGVLELLGSIGTDSGRSRRTPSHGSASRQVSLVDQPAGRPDANVSSSGSSAAAASTPRPVARDSASRVAVPAPTPSTWNAGSQTASRAWIGRLRDRLTARVGLLALAIVTVLAAGAAIIWLPFGREGTVAPPPGPVLVVIDASPWATIRGIRSESGERHSLPQNASTPLAVSLTPGSYRVSLVGPPPASELREVGLRVEANASPRVYEPFPSMTAEDYLRDVLQARNEKRGAPGRGR